MTHYEGPGIRSWENSKVWGGEVQVIVLHIQPDGAQRSLRGVGTPPLGRGCVLPGPVPFPFGCLGFKSDYNFSKFINEESHGTVVIGY